jgi:hypothetical protein
MGQDKRLWSEVRVNLNGNYNYTENILDWDRAIKIFSERLEDYFFNPLKHLRKFYDKPNSGEGFSMVTLQCALIETFAALKEGKIHNRNPIFKYEYKDCMDLFVNFLETENIFINLKDDAKNFYTEVRCGLMHETRTKSVWKIKACAKCFKKINNRTDISDDAILAKNGVSGRIIFRNQLQDALENYFKQYKIDLADRNKNELRKLFARKLDHLFLTDDELETAKNTFNWWKHDCECKYCNAPMNVEPIAAGD